MNNTIGVFHRLGTQVKFDPIERADALKRFREYYSGQSWTVLGFEYHGKQSTGSPVYARGDIDALIESGATGGFNPHFRHILGGKKKGGAACGQAELGADESAAFDVLQGCGGDTTLHESMHNGLGDGTPSRIGTGLGHSHRLRNGKVVNMGDHSSLMGSGQGQGLLSPHICCLGWNDPYETNIVTKSAYVKIAAVENDALFQDESKHVIVRVEGQPDLYLSTRQNYPYLCDRTAPPERLYLHEFYPHGHPSITGDFPNTTLRLPDLMPGEAMHGSVSVRYVEWVEGIARVEITMGEME